VTSSALFQADCRCGRMYFSPLYIEKLWVTVPSRHDDQPGSAWPTRIVYSISAIAIWARAVSRIPMTAITSTTRIIAAVMPRSDPSRGVPATRRQASESACAQPDRGRSCEHLVRMGHGGYGALALDELGAGSLATGPVDIAANDT
jgi:hypothetical protein